MSAKKKKTKKKVSAGSGTTPTGRAKKARPTAKKVASRAVQKPVRKVASARKPVGKTAHKTSKKTVRRAANPGARARRGMSGPVSRNPCREECDSCDKMCIRLPDVEPHRCRKHNKASS